MIELGLQRISRLLAKTPLPWRAIHVAGTNGKGSICACISSMLDAYNGSLRRAVLKSPKLKHARFTSPHLIDRWDCITINQRTVPFSTFDAVESEVLQRNREEAIGATEFELLTATAFEIFTREKVDVGVVEVGMGGRLDATNIIGQTDGVDIPKGFDSAEFRAPPLVTAISSIGLDHQGFLGNTIEEIAREKAGIIKPGVPSVHDYYNDSRVRRILQDIAMMHSPSDGWGHDRQAEADYGRFRKRFGMPDESPEGLPAVRNIIVAYGATWEALRELGLLRNEPTLKKRHGIMALKHNMLKAACSTTFPGRQQLININTLTDRKEYILLDGAHNADSARALSTKVSELYPDHASGQRSLTWVIAASDSKDVKEILAPLLRDEDSVFAVEFGPVDGMPWVKPLPTARLLDAARSSASLETSQDCGRDVLHALKAASKLAAGGPLVVAGSLYLVGDVLRSLRNSEGANLAKSSEPLIREGELQPQACAADSVKIRRIRSR